MGCLHSDLEWQNCFYKKRKKNTLLKTKIFSKIFFKPFRLYLQIGGISKVIELANTELYLVLSELSYFEDEQSSQFVVRGSHERYHTPNTSKSGSSAPKKVPIHRCI